DELSAVRDGVEELRRVTAALEAELEATRRDRDEVGRRLREVTSTRVWRLGTLYWRLLERLGLLPAKAGGEPAPRPDSRLAPAA
ncbi:hypothetical protein NL529_31820, partial [Klebsiella pneumoniae]|nr:hypothetical protein [Klebsiella pneumoniae]